MNLNKLLKTLLFAGLFLIPNILSAKEYRVTIKGEMLKSATSEAGYSTTVSGIPTIVEDKPSQIVLELQDILLETGSVISNAIVLNAVNILVPEAKLVSGGFDKEFEIPIGILTYRGTINETENLNLCFTRNGIVGNFSVSGKDYSIKPANGEPFDKNSRQHLITEVKTQECGDNWCKTDVSKIPKEITELMAKSGEPQLKSTQAPLIARVAVETDYET